MSEGPDEKRVRLRGCGDGGDSEVGVVAVFSARCRPHMSPRPREVQEQTEKKNAQL